MPVGQVAQPVGATTLLAWVATVACTAAQVVPTHHVPSLCARTYGTPVASDDAGDAAHCTVNRMPAGEPAAALVALNRSVVLPGTSTAESPGL